MAIKKTLSEDLKAVKIDIDENISNIYLLKHFVYAMVFYPNFACVFWYRVNRFLVCRKLPFQKLLRRWRFYRFGNDISPYASIGPGLRLVHVTDIVIGDHVIIGSHVTIFNGVTLGAKAINIEMEMPRVGSNVFIGTGAKIIGGINIGNNIIIGALVYCSKSIPSNSVVHSNPMQVITDQQITSDPSGKFFWNKI